jgi:non-heme chloroperoxidase
MSAIIAPVIDSVRLANNVRLEYVEQGDPTGLPVVCLHGVTDSWHSFEPVLPLLPSSLRVFSLTQRGHGDSDRPAHGYHLRDFAADVSLFLDAQGIDDAVIVGHSMGSVVAQRFALDYPGRTRGLVLMGTFLSFRANPGMAEFCELAAGLEDPIDREFARQFQADTLAHPVAPAFFELVVAESMKVPARVWSAAFSAFLEDENTAELDRIAAPTLLVWGERDAFAPRADQDGIVARIPGARLLVYEGAGHALHWEDPARFAADLAAFVREIAG